MIYHMMFQVFDPHPPVTVGLAHLDPLTQRSSIPHLYGSLRSNRSAAAHGKDPGSKSYQTVSVSEVV